MPMRRLEAHPSEDMNSLVKWHIIKNPLRVTFNFTLFTSAVLFLRCGSKESF